jgi:hypothetical protein
VVFYDDVFPFSMSHNILDNDRHQNLDDNVWLQVLGHLQNRYVLDKLISIDFDNSIFECFRSSTYNQTDV